jgi:hypothetical protein
MFKDTNTTMFADMGGNQTNWMVEGTVPDFLLMKAREIRYLCMLGYTFYHGYKLFGTLKDDQSMAFKFVRMIFQCTGGGILVPLFINAIPVSLGNDAYPIAIGLAFLLHLYFPKLRDIVKNSPYIRSALVVLFETQRASVVTKLTTSAAAAMPATEFDFPLFGPIFCGGIAGCGGAFLPLDKGLSPIEDGLKANMGTALAAATCYHLFMNTSMSYGVENAASKAQLVMALFFISYSLYTDVGFSALFKSVPSAVPVVEKKSAEKPKKA